MSTILYKGARLRVDIGTKNEQVVECTKVVQFNTPQSTFYMYQNSHPGNLEYLYDEESVYVEKGYAEKKFVKLPNIIEFQFVYLSAVSSNPTEKEKVMTKIQKMCTHWLHNVN